MSIQKVKEFFKQYNRENDILEFDVSSATVQLASIALNCKEAQIAKSMSFELSNKYIIIVLPGDKKIDNSKFKHQFNVKAKMVNPIQLVEKIGHEMGGVCPFAINEDVEVYLDESLKEHSVVFPACGSSNSAIKLTIEELEKYSNYIKYIDVSKDK